MVSPVHDWYRSVRILAGRKEGYGFFTRILLPLDKHGKCTAQEFADLLDSLTTEQGYEVFTELKHLFNCAIGSRRREGVYQRHETTTISGVMPSWARDIRQDKVFYNRVFIRIGHIPWDADKTYWIEEFVSSFSSRLCFVSSLFKFGRKPERYTDGTLGAYVFRQLCWAGFTSQGLRESYRANPEFYVFCQEQKELLGKHNPYNPRHVKAPHLYQIFDRKVSAASFVSCYEFYAYALKILNEYYLRFPSEESPLGKRFAKLNNDYKVFILKELMSADAEQELYIRDIVNQGLEGSYFDYADLVRAVLA